MYRSILVPLDGSSFGEHALPLALRLARQSGAGLQIVHVHGSPAPLYAEGDPTYSAEVDAAMRKNEQAYLDRIVERLASMSRTPVQAALLEGPIGEALEERVRQTNVSLVVLTTHGHGLLARAWLGSVADELVRRLPVPVLALRPNDAKVDLAREAGVRRICIALDGSEHSERIVGPALELGCLLGAEYTLVQVIKPDVLGQHDAAATNQGLDPWLMQQLQEGHEGEQARAKAYLECVAESLRARSLKVETRVLSHDQPAVAILEEAKARRADLLALATHGRSGLPRLFLGSVADKVVRGACIPVLLVRPPAP
jgi:nucleotide-binding universal stress UspA family protein